jgi:hypothetical protein
MANDLAALLRIRERQAENRFLADYLPSTMATREEAPSASWRMPFKVEQLGRLVHCLSHPELHAALLALHHPDLCDLHEQKMLHPFPAAHPLFGFPGYVDAGLTPVRGTLDVASRLNCRQQHPLVWVRDPDSGSKAPVAFPYQGDLLLFIRVGSRIKLVDWPIKKEASDFTEPSPAASEKMEREQQKLRFRAAIQRLYNDDIGVPTIEVAGADLDQAMVGNLRAAFPSAKRDVPLNQHVKNAILHAFRRGVTEHAQPNQIIGMLAFDGLCTIEQGRTLFYQYIWNRSLRVDLFENVVLDSPLRPERVDVFQHYAHLFPGCLPSDIRSGAAP